MNNTTTHYPGPDDPGKSERLSHQHTAIKELMSDGQWRTLEQISHAVEAMGVRCPPASASAQLRHLRKERFGGHTVKKVHRGNGLYEYQLVVTKQQKALW